MSENNDKIVFQGQTETIYKIIVIGDPSVGKTSLLSKYSTNLFPEQYLPTVGVNIVKERLETTINNEDIVATLMMWDIAGQPQFYMLHKPYFNGADGIILVFDITRSSSFSNVKNWWNTCIKHGLSSIPRVLIGNKVDLKDDRKIVQPHADHLSEELNAEYFETSAKTGINVKKIFETIAKKVFLSKTKH
ncbi:MAG: GTP-binding protein [Promethearchaeota archaeon]|nr:MAG: GTP-binding protein [Candidatus Lokiarchaeota archaeon]